MRFKKVHLKEFEEKKPQELAFKEEKALGKHGIFSPKIEIKPLEPQPKPLQVPEVSQCSMKPRKKSKRYESEFTRKYGY